MGWVYWLKCMQWGGSWSRDCLCVIWSGSIKNPASRYRTNNQTNKRTANSNYSMILKNLGSNYMNYQENYVVTVVIYLCLILHKCRNHRCLDCIKDCYHSRHRTGECGTIHRQFAGHIVAQEVAWHCHIPKFCRYIIWHISNFYTRITLTLKPYLGVFWTPANSKGWYFCYRLDLVAGNFSNPSQHRGFSEWCSICLSAIWLWC